MDVTKINVAKNTRLILGDNFAVSNSSQINCYKKLFSESIYKFHGIALVWILKRIVSLMTRIN